ncbi:MAG TPA: Cache 3/Cache 2 fusion domain-containing protein [Tenuifilaceae bacterium]|nr:Cache 3/Cache 2 fusion domain-containing protein [Tenuifilaceae bacterium]
MKRKAYVRLSLGDDIFKRLRLPLKIRLFLPISFIIILVVVIATIWFVSTSINSINEQIESNLELEVKTISKMFERESMLKLKNVQTNLKVASHHFYSHKLSILKRTIDIEVENQRNGLKHMAKVNVWRHNNHDLYGSNDFVDSLTMLLGGTVSIFQKIDSGYVRIATNVPKADGSRATGTYIPNDSPVSESIRNKNTYFGRAFVVNDWYTTAYEPIVMNDEVVGMIYVGDKEKDMQELKRILSTLKIGKSGYPFVCERNGFMLIHPTMEGDTWDEPYFLSRLNSAESGVFPLFFHNRDKTIAFTHFNRFELIIAASIIKEEENKVFIRRAIIGASTVGFITILLLMVFLYFFTTERLYRYFTQLEISRRKLASVELALKQSEKLATMGQISAGIAHELNNPLGVITMYSNILLEELDKDSPMVKDLELIVEQANRCKGIVGGLLNFARKSKIKPMEVNIVEFAKRSIGSIVVPENIIAEIKAKVSQPYIMIDSEQMMQVFTNLEKNAVEAMPKGGKLTIDIEDNDSSMIINFSDSGTGIAEADLDKLFTPFFTSKEFGKGTGLGLPLVYGIVKMHRGKIEVESNNDLSKGPTGTTFILTIPRNM